MTVFIIELKGCLVRVKSCHETFNCVADWIAADFSPMVSSRSNKDAHVEINLVSEIPSEKAPDGRGVRGASFWYRGIQIVGLASHRVCKYPHGILAETKLVGPTRVFWISGKNLFTLWEVTFSAIHSVLGELLDLKGFHRAHGLGFEAHDRRFLLLGRSGAGKSSLAIQLSRLNKVSLFSDECPLLCKRDISEFPIRFGVEPRVAEAIGLKSHTSFFRRAGKTKVTAPFPRAKLARAGPVDFLFILKPSIGEPKIELASKHSAFLMLMESLVVGFGILKWLNG